MGGQLLSWFGDHLQSGDTLNCKEQKFTFIKWPPRAGSCPRRKAHAFHGSANAKTCTRLFLWSHLMLFKNKIFHHVILSYTFSENKWKQIQIFFFLHIKYAFMLYYVLFLKICFRNMQKKKNPVSHLLLKMCLSSYTLEALRAVHFWRWLPG